MYVVSSLDVSPEMEQKLIRTSIYVVCGLRQALLGRPAIEALKVVSLVAPVQEGDILKKFPELFKGLGRLKDNYVIKLQEGAIPFALSILRRGPIPLLPKVKEELQRMENLGVIRKINKPTEWYAGMVVVPKEDGRIRICVNRICHERNILLSVEQTLAQIGGAKHFSKLDANSGFWQIELDPETAKLTTFITPVGRFCF